MRDRNLYEALMDFNLARTGGQLTFLDRLCRENNWTRDFGARAIDEYKRFVYLAMVSPMPVTPSDEVDQVWHLHLLYTRSYWEEMTRLLPRPLHHGPTTGGQAEDDKFNDWYERTKALYEAEFGEAPPAELWPPADERFDPRHRYRRLDTANFWVIPKPGWQLGRGASAFAVLPMAGFIDPSMIFAGILFASLFLIVVGLAMSNQNQHDPRRKKDDGGGGSSCGGGGCSSSSGDCGGGDGGSGCSGGGGCGGGGCGGGGCGS